MWLRRVRQPVQRFVTLQHLGHAIHHGKSPVLFEIRVKMGGVGGQHHPAALGPHSGNLQSGRVPAHAMQSQTGHYFGLTIMKNGAAAVDFSHHLERILQIVRFAQEMVAHAAARSRIGHLAILNVKACGRKAIEIPGVVVMQMSQDHIRDFVRIDVEQPQRFYRAAQMLALAAYSRFLRESGIDNEQAIAAAHHPDEIIEIRPELVRIGQDKALAGMAIPKMTVANGKYFERFHSSRSIIIMDNAPGKCALITGSTQGLGLATAKRFAAAGCNVIINGLGDEREIAAMQAGIEKEHGVRTLYSGANLANAIEIERMIGVGVETFGAIDILVNNAVVRHADPVEQFPVGEWDLAIAVNLSAAFHTIRLALPGMRKRDWGRIVNVSSIYGMIGTEESRRLRYHEDCAHRNDASRRARNARSEYHLQRDLPGGGGNAGARENNRIK